MDSYQKENFERLIDNYVESKTALMAFVDARSDESIDRLQAACQRLGVENKRLNETTNTLATQLHTAELQVQKLTSAPVAPKRRVRK